MYNGHVKAGTAPNGNSDMFYHYWLAESEGDPSKDPVVFWYQGGPGASSLFGLLQELGPLMLNAESYDAAYNATGIPSLVPNPWSWTKVATVVAVDSPAPIGFSYCDPPGPAGAGTSCGNWTDTLAAEASHGFLSGFFAGFPEFQVNDAYITGESYGGVYVPMLVDQVLQRPIPHMALKGFAVVDGAPGGWNGDYYDVEFWHGHGQISNALYYQIQKECPEEVLRNGSGYSRECKRLVTQVDEEVGGYYGYNLYDECPHSGPFLSNMRREGTIWGGGPPGTSSPCPLSALTDWLALPQTKQALGLPPSAHFFDTDNGNGFHYRSSHGDLLKVYERAVHAGLRVLSINGGADPGTDGRGQDTFLSWAAAKGLRQTQRWRAWTVDGRKHVGGHMMEWADGAFTWARVRGSGHMVPEYKPLAALTLITSFVNGKQLPRYHAPPGAARRRLRL